MTRRSSTSATLHGPVVDELGRQVVAGRWPTGSTLPNEDELAADSEAAEGAMRALVEFERARMSKEGA
jgi:DNA-binding FadR family transcriptional regulator